MAHSFAMFDPGRPRFCERCGQRTEPRIPADDNRLRAICTGCGHIRYDNPINVVGTLPLADDGRVLLCRRAIEPRRGYWTLPAGFLELGESLQEGALRETAEEAGARVALGPLLSAIDVLHVGQVHVFFRARLLDLQFDPGSETLELALFDWAALPWDDLAFRTVRATLEHQRSGAQHALFTSFPEKPR